MKPSVKYASDGISSASQSRRACRGTSVSPENHAGKNCERERTPRTGYNPGIQVGDVLELLDHGARVVVLSRGMAECFHVPRETLGFLKERQIGVHLLPTKEAVALYNKLAETEPVGGFSYDMLMRCPANGVALPGRALDFIQRRRVFQSRCIAEFFAEVRGAHDPTHHFCVPRLWNVVYKEHVTRRQGFSQVASDILF